MRTVARVSGLSKPMLDYLCRAQIVLGAATGRHGRGRKRRYTFAEIVLLRIIGRLLAAGVSSKRMKSGLAKLRQSPALRSAAEEAGWYLITDGTDVYLRHGSEVVERFMDNGQLSFAFVVEVASVREDVRIELARVAGVGG